MNGKSQEDAKDVTAGVVYRQKLIFVPGKRLKNMMKQSGVTRMTVNSEDATGGIPEAVTLAKKIMKTR